MDRQSTRAGSRRNVQMLLVLQRAQVSFGLDNTGSLNGISLKKLTFFWLVFSVLAWLLAAGATALTLPRCYETLDLWV